jgi:hypothetical protein
VNVTLAPAGDGLTELAKVVVVTVGVTVPPGVVTVTVSPVAEALSTLIDTP